MNISTASALVVAACGQAVAKHGNRSASGNSGSAEVLKELGIEIDPGADRLRRKVLRTWASPSCSPRSFHPGARVTRAAVRRQLPFRTLFQPRGPAGRPRGRSTRSSASPASGPRSWSPRPWPGSGRRSAAVVVRGEDGLDEVTLGGRTGGGWVESGELLAGRGPPTTSSCLASRRAARVAGPAGACGAVACVPPGRGRPRPLVGPGQRRRGPSGGGPGRLAPIEAGRAGGRGRRLGSGDGAARPVGGVEPGRGPRLGGLRPVGGVSVGPGARGPFPDRSQFGINVLMERV